MCNTCNIVLCSGEVRCNACVINHEHLLSSMSVPILPVIAGSP